MEQTIAGRRIFGLDDHRRGAYWYHHSERGTFVLGSDAITHSYKNQVRKQWLVQQIPNEVNALFDLGSTIGAFTIFPKNKIDNQHTLNQARGISPWIDDRFDLTLECIRRYYAGQSSPLFDTLDRYSAFFELFQDFEGYCDFFLLQDLIDDAGKIKFYLPFDDFNTRPQFAGVEDYRMYKKGVMRFIRARNQRIGNFTNHTAPANIT